MTYYKVVKKVKNRRFSITVNKPSTLRAEYFKGKWTHARPGAVKLGYGLMIYNDLKAAQNQISAFSKYELWEIEVGEVWCPKVNRVFWPSGLTVKMLKKFGGVDKFAWGESVLMTDKVKLIKKLDI